MPCGAAGGRAVEHGVQRARHVEIVQQRGDDLIGDGSGCLSRMAGRAVERLQPALGGGQHVVAEVPRLRPRPIEQARAAAPPGGWHSAHRAPARGCPSTSPSSARPRARFPRAARRGRTGSRRSRFRPSRFRTRGAGSADRRRRRADPGWNPVARGPSRRSRHATRAAPGPHGLGQAGSRRIAGVLPDRHVERVGAGPGRAAGWSPSRPSSCASLPS